MYGEVSTILKKTANLSKSEREKRVDAVISDYESGFSIKEISERHNISKQGFYYLLDRYGKTTERRYGNPISDENINKIIDMYKNGDRVKYISKVLGIYYPKVSKVLHDNGVGFRTFKVNPIHIDKIKERYLNGESAEAISKDYDCCAYSIVKYLSKVGVESRRNIKKVTPEDSKKIYEMVKTGVRVSKIARKMGISETAAYYHIRKQAAKNGDTSIRNP